MKDTRPYGGATRLFHGTLAIAIILQLASSQFMQVPRGGKPENWAFEVHEYSGMTALFLAIGFWMVVMSRRRGTDLGTLVPWFSAARRRALWSDIGVHWRALKAFRLPAYDRDAAFPSAIHGLGLLLMTAMATTGTIYYLAGLAGVQQNGAIHLMMEAHGLGGNLVWAYLIGHAALGVLHHFKNDMSLADMWSVGSNKTERTLE